ncbi:hypothetical protein GKZ89_15545 [Bacillus mangrovi]|uniref:Uncharacterized protein n=1 Tax=Metabacillus mangrovi TaxID=1491830 RepID=A0A7X2S8P4_9BACI|nr:hypothetical protein [Metabacillus mangrovi]
MDLNTQVNGARNAGRTDAKFEIAKNMLQSQSLSVQDVAKFTGLPLDKVIQLEKEVR